MKQNDISLKNCEKLFLAEKNQTSSLKSGGIFGKKKYKTPQVRSTFFETTSEAKCPEKPGREAFLLEQLVLHVLCRSRVYLSLSTRTTSLARFVPKPGAKLFYLYG